MKTNASPDLALLILRIALGAIMLAHGLQKVGLVPGGAPNLQATIDGFAGMGIPPWMGYLSVTAELAGGLALLIGFLGRLAAFGVAVNMSTAIFKVHASKGFFAPAGFEFPAALLAIAAALLVTGMGAYSVDAAIARSMDRTIHGKNREQPPNP